MFTSSNTALQQLADNCCYFVGTCQPDGALDEFEALGKLALRDETLDLREVAELAAEMSYAINRHLKLSWSQGERFVWIRWLVSSACPQAHLYA